mgnify:CR=1 FL=1
MKAMKAMKEKNSKKAKRKVEAKVDACQEAEESPEVEDSHGDDEAEGDAAQRLEVGAISQKSWCRTFSNSFGLWLLDEIKVAEDRVHETWSLACSSQSQPQQQHQHAHSESSYRETARCSCNL